jgi:hypothetical protein
MPHPLIVFAASLFVMWLAAQFGNSVLKKRRPLTDEEREAFSVVQAATLTLLGLIIGFSFSMAVGRYDQRKNLEEAEANAIGTELVRSDLLPRSDGEKVRGLLKAYLDQRILFYKARDDDQKLRTIEEQTLKLQADLWSAVQAPATAQPSLLMALAVSGMNDVLNSQGYTQAAWWNRIPTAAWILMILIAVCSNAMIGYGARGSKRSLILLSVLPLVLSITFLLIADIDSPRGGFIHVYPQNLQSLADSVRAR